MSGASLPKRPSTSLAFQLPCCDLQLQHGLLLDQVQYIKTPKQPGVQRPPCQIGPVENCLINYGRVRDWVFGAFGECSIEVHIMVQRLAKAKVQRAGTQPSRSHLLINSRETQLAEEVAFVQ